MSCSISIIFFLKKSLDVVPWMPYGILLACVCVCARARACVRACVHACVLCVCNFACLPENAICPPCLEDERSAH